MYVCLLLQVFISDSAVSLYKTRVRTKRRSLITMTTLRGNLRGLRVLGDPHSVATRTQPQPLECPTFPHLNAKSSPTASSDHLSFYSVGVTSRTHHCAQHDCCRSSSGVLASGGSFWQGHESHHHQAGLGCGLDCPFPVSQRSLFFIHYPLHYVCDSGRKISILPLVSEDFGLGFPLTLFYTCSLS